jgi:hypothetical protein
MTRPFATSCSMYASKTPASTSSSPSSSGRTAEMTRRMPSRTAASSFERAASSRGSSASSSAAWRRSRSATRCRRSSSRRRSGSSCSAVTSFGALVGDEERGGAGVVGAGESGEERVGREGLEDVGALPFARNLEIVLWSTASFRPISRSPRPAAMSRFASARRLPARAGGAGIGEHRRGASLRGALE